MYKAWFAKIEECEDCGWRLSVRQKYCPNCGKPNQDYRKRNWTAVAGIEENEEKKEGDEQKENLTN
jgi:ribosomal protein L37E